MILTGFDQNPAAGENQETEQAVSAAPEAPSQLKMEKPPEGNLPAVVGAPGIPAGAEVAAKKDTRFQPGQSGNPSGRPKRTKEEKDALNEVRKLAPKAVERLKQILEDSTVSKAILLKAIEIVFDRTYGKPEASVKVTSVQETLQESEAYVMAIVQRARNRLREETADE